MLEQEVYQLIKGISGGRVYPLRLPQGTDFPAIDFTFIEPPPSEHQSGFMRTPRVRFSIWARTWDDVLTASSELTGLLGYHVFDGKFSSRYQGLIDRPDPETGMFRRIVDFEVWGN